MPRSSHGSAAREAAVPAPRRLGLEEKVDGWRMLAYRDGTSVRLIARNGVDHTRRFRELAAAVAKLPAPTLVLDGEVAVYDEKLVSCFHLLGDEERGLLCTPPLFIAFDVLQVGREDLRRRPLHERRAVLDDVIDDDDMVLPCRRLLDDPAIAWAIVEERGYEGMVAKDPESTYRGGPTRAWIKVKVRHEGVLLVWAIATSTPSTACSSESTSGAPRVPRCGGVGLPGAGRARRHALRGSYPCERHGS